MRIRSSKSFGRPRVTRCVQQLLLRPHVALDVRPGFGQQGLQHGLSRLLVQAMLRRGGRGSERLFEERDADAFGAADFLESGGRPWLALDHLGKQGQPHRDDLAFLSQASDGLIEEGVLLFGALAEVVGQAPKARPKAASTLRA